MSASSLKITCLAMLVAFGVATNAQAQLDDACSPFYGCSNDMRFFEPVDLDLDCRGCGPPCGFFFRYDKMAVATTGERAEIGDPNTDQLVFPIYGGVALDPETGQPIQRPIITNSIRSAVPRAVFDLGDRYEFGYWGEEGKGWAFSILNGPDNIQTFDLGFSAPTDDPDEDDPLFTQLDSVFVSFRTEVGSLAGFLDVVLPDGSIDLDGDGFADDFNANSQFGPNGFDTDGDGTPDLFVGAFPDYGDLVTLTTGYTSVRAQNTLKINGFELMRGHRLDNGHFMVKHQNNHFEWGYGARLL
ncbi:hypothetical protein N9N28_14810, partial [Rubripirellula amarantea]|nr:hypothetical protein [Rubripirellula amarantea]